MIRVCVLTLVALLVSGCQTTDYSANSGIRKTGVCDDMPITSTAEVMPLRGEDCIVLTPTGGFSAAKFGAVFKAQNRKWNIYASFTKSGSGTFMEALPFWDAMNNSWNYVRTDARNKTGAKETQINGRSVKTGRFELERSGRTQSCMGFLVYGNYKSAGYDKRVDGYICTIIRDDDEWFHEIISSINLDELLT